MNSSRALDDDPSLTEIDGQVATSDEIMAATDALSAAHNPKLCVMVFAAKNSHCLILSGQQSQSEKFGPLDVSRSGCSLFKLREPGLFLARSRQADAGFHDVLVGGLDESNHDVVNRNACHAGDEVCVGMEHAQLRGGVAARPNSSMESDGRGWLAVLEYVT